MCVIHMYLSILIEQYNTIQYSVIIWTQEHWEAGENKQRQKGG